MWTPLKHILYPKTYIWVDVMLIKETRKAILIEFDNRQAWFPKSWIAGVRSRHCGEVRQSQPLTCRSRKSGDPKPISIKICEYHWAKKFG